jgi:UDP-glucose 4-epimerase
MNVLVTGGAGFIGSAVARALLARGDSVVIADNLSTGRRENVPDAATFLALDLGDPASLRHLPTTIDVVCHLAAQSSGPASADRAYEDMQSNAASTLLLSRWCLQHTIARFVYASSMAVYGQAYTSPVTEDHACLPVSYYGISKLTSEHVLRLAALQGLSVTSLRLFSVYGPGQDLGNLRQGMVSIFLAYMLRHSEVPVTGNLERVRDFTYIDDVVDAWLAMIDRPRTPSAVYNVGTGLGTTVGQLLDALQHRVTRRVPIVLGKTTVDDQSQLWADIARIRTDVGWSPTTPLEAGLDRMVAWATSLDGSGAVIS